MKLLRGGTSPEATDRDSAERAPTSLPAEARYVGTAHHTAGDALVSRHLHSSLPLSLADSSTPMPPCHSHTHTSTYVPAYRGHSTALHCTSTCARRAAPPHPLVQTCPPPRPTRRAARPTVPVAASALFPRLLPRVGVGVGSYHYHPTSLPTRAPLATGFLSTARTYVTHSKARDVPPPAPPARPQQSGRVRLYADPRALLAGSSMRVLRGGVPKKRQ